MRWFFRLIGIVCALSLLTCYPIETETTHYHTTQKTAPLILPLTYCDPVLDDAANWWNSRFTEDLFIVAAENENCQVLPLLFEYEPVGDDENFVAKVYRIEDDRWVVLYEPGYEYVLNHELGHVLGLKHVDEESDIMYKSHVSKYEFLYRDLTPATRDKVSRLIY